MVKVVKLKLTARNLEKKDIDLKKRSAYIFFHHLGLI